MKWTLVALALVGACKGNPPDTAREDDIAAMHKALIAPERRGPAFNKGPEPLPAAATSNAPGPALLYISDVGLVTIAVDGTVTQQRLDAQRVGSLALDHDGAVIIGGHTVLRVKDGASQVLGGDGAPDLGTYSQLRIAPDGKIWARNVMGLYAWDGTKWTTYPVKTPSDFTFDGKGRVYTVGDKEIGVIDGAAWEKMYDVTGSPHEGVVPQPSFYSVDIVGNQVVAAYSNGFIKLDGKNVETVERTPTSSSLGTGRVIGSDFVGVYTGNEPHLIRTSLAGGSDKVVPIKFSAERDYVDGRGRAWLFSTAGAHIVDLEGTSTSWPVGSIPELNGSIAAVAIIGSGPDKLPTAGKISKGTIIGHVVNKDAPVAKAYVEVCQHPGDTVRKDSTPCQNMPIHGSGETDEKGAFSISDLPLQDYDVVIRDGDKWYRLVGSQCAGMHDGDTCDIGALDLSNKPFAGFQ